MSTGCPANPAGSTGGSRCSTRLSWAIGGWSGDEVDLVQRQLEYRLAGSRPAVLGLRLRSRPGCSVMAIVLDTARCAICKEPLGDRPYLATSGAAFEPTHRMFEYCDAPIHWDCYEPWPSRSEFARAYFELKVAAEAENPSWARVYVDEDVLVLLSLSLPEEELAVCLASVGIGNHVALADWEHWLEHSSPDLQPSLLQRSIAEVRDRLLEHLPDPSVIRSRVEVARQREKVETLQRAREIHEQARRARIDENHARAERLARDMAEGGYACPHCGSVTFGARYYDGSPESESYFVCDLCARSFTP